MTGSLSPLNTTDVEQALLMIVDVLIISALMRLKKKIPSKETFFPTLNKAVTRTVDSRAKILDTMIKRVGF